MSINAILCASTLFFHFNPAGGGETLIEVILLQLETVCTKFTKTKGEGERESESVFNSRHVQYTN